MRIATSGQLNRKAIELCGIHFQMMTFGIGCCEEKEEEKREGRFYIPPPCKPPKALLDLLREH
jgi:hypothetical protein